MKKFVLFLLLVTMALSVITMAACKKDTVTEAQTESFVSRVKGSAQKSNSTQASSLPPTSVLESTPQNSNVESAGVSTTGSAVNSTPTSSVLAPTSDQTSVGTSASENSTSTNQPTSSETSVTPPTSEVLRTNLIEALITSIDEIGTVDETSYSTKLTAIEACETSYSELTTAEKELVTNYTTLTSARTTYNQLYADAQAKPFVDDFKAKVLAIATYEFTTDYKALLDAADVSYDAVPEAYKTSVATEKQTLENNKQQYAQDVINALPQAVKDVIASISAIGVVSPDNYTTKLTIISASEELYAALSADEKLLVSNYSTLEAARSDYDGYLAEATAIAGFIADFKTKVGEIATFEYTTAYKALLDAADVAYQNVPSSHISEVATEKATLDARKQQYADNLAVATFMTSFNALSSVTMSSDNVSQFNALIASYDALTTTQKTLVDATTTSTIATYRANVGNFKPSIVFDFNTISGSASNSTQYFTTTSYTTSGDYSITKNSGSFTVTDVFGAVFAGSSLPVKGLAVTSTNLSKFEVSLNLSANSKVTIFFSRANGSKASYLTSVGSGFTVSGTGTAPSSTIATAATTAQVTSGADKVAVLTADCLAGTAKFNLANSSRVVIYKIIIQ